MMESDMIRHMNQTIRPHSNADTHKIRRTRFSKTLNYAAPAKCVRFTNAPVNASLNQRKGSEPNISRTTLSDGRPERNTFMKDNSGFLIPQRTKSFKQSFRPKYSSKLEKEYLDEVASLVNEFKEVEYEYIIDKCHSYAVNVIKKKQMKNHRNKKTNQMSNCAVSNTGELKNSKLFDNSPSFILNPTANPTNNNNQNMSGPSTKTLKHNSRDKLICILKDWTMVRNENSDSFLSGTLLKMPTAEVLEERHVSSKIIKRIKTNVVETQLCIYVLQEKLQDSYRAIQKEMKSVFENYGFPEMWQPSAEHLEKLFKSDLLRSTSHLFNMGSQYYERSSQCSGTENKKHNKSSSSQMIQNHRVRRSHSESKDYSTRTRVTNKRSNPII